MTCIVGDHEDTFAECEPLFRHTLNDQEFKAFSDKFHKLKANFSPLIAFLTHA